MGDLFDKRQQLFSDSFEKALSYERYLETGTEAQQKKWSDFQGRFSLSGDQSKLLSGFVRKMNVLVISGIWCGDCARQGPMLQCIAEGSACIDLRLLDNEENPELRDEFRIHGAGRVPVVAFLSEDFFEVGRFGDRTLGHYRSKAEKEFGPACDAGIVPPPAEQLNQELQEWIDQFERVQLMLRLSPFLRKRHGD